MGYDVKRFADLGVLAEDVICPICMSVFENPITTKCRHTYCKDCIKEWCQNNCTCPLDQAPIEYLDELVPAPIFVQNILGRLLIACDFQEQGCSEMIKLEDLPSHRSTCPFRPKRTSTNFLENVSKTAYRWSSCVFSNLTRWSSWLTPIRRRLDRLDVDPRQARFQLRPRPAFDVLIRRRQEREELERNERLFGMVLILFGLIAASVSLSFMLRLTFDVLEKILMDHTSLVFFFILLYLLVNADQNVHPLQERDTIDLILDDF